MALRRGRLLGALLICAAIIGCQAENARVDDAQMKEITQLWQKVPIHPSMVEVNGSSSPSGAQKGVHKKYASSAPFDSVKGYYVEKLPHHGWKFIKDRELKHYGMFKGERLLEFHQGKYQLNIRYNGERKAEFGSDYLVSVGLRQ